MVRSGRLKLAAAITALLILCGCGAGADRIPAEDAAVGPAPAEPGETVPEVPAEPPPAEPAPEQEIVPQTDPAEEILKTLSTEEKVAQLFLVRYDDSLETSGLPDPGGYILFAPDFENKTADEVSAFTAALQENSKTPLLIATDEEGGAVCRVSLNENLRSEPFNSPRWLINNGGAEAVAADAAEKCGLLLSLGINVNMAPVCDLCDDPSAFMYRRSAGNVPDTCDFVRTTVKISEEAGLGSVLKHFPGYGENSDSHTASVMDDRPLEQFYAADFLPFVTGIEAGADAVLVSHNTVTAMDAEHPASLSAEVHRILRRDLGFEGVIITDDLIMQAVSECYTPGQAAVLAVRAGNDMLCSSEYDVQYSALLAALERGEISTEIIDAAARRVIEWKISLGIIGG
ncbi:MAG: beta-hexosaminidase [Oscillospiraceae bacterium]|nr:beta-hexosaminidase [Oscillospiraceae bacterium]